VGLLRYPGSKAKIADRIVKSFPDRFNLPLWITEAEYREPFFGAGAVGFRLMRDLPLSAVWINDLDPGIHALWSAVYGFSGVLCRRVIEFAPTVQAFWSARERAENPGLGVLDRGFDMLVIHRLGHGGFGKKSWGPQGGNDQDNAKYPIGCRWRPGALVREIQRLNRLLRSIPSVRISCLDFSDVITAPGDSFVYADPPYYVKGQMLYEHAMDTAGHVRLARLLRARGDWVLSYDDHPFIRGLYDGFRAENVDIDYSIRNQGKPRKNSELLIFSNPADDAVRFGASRRVTP